MVGFFTSLFILLYMAPRQNHTSDPEYISRSGLPVSTFIEQCKSLNKEKNFFFNT